MAGKKTTKTEKQAEKKQPTELKDDELDTVEGAILASPDVYFKDRERGPDGRLDPGAFEPPPKVK